MNQPTDQRLSSREEANRPIDEISFSDFIASSIHDMKNSLMMQLNSLENIATEYRQKGQSDVVDALGDVVYEAKRMNGNLIQLLGLYKFDRDIYPLDISEQDMADLIREAVVQNKSSLDRKGLSIEVRCDEALQWYVDRDLVTSILFNALTNAYHYTQDKILIAAEVSDNRLELRVEDNGRGYPSNMLQEIAGEAAKGISFASGSTGLGFHFAARAARMHSNGARQGTLRIENGGSLGGGCFIVSLP